MTALLPSGWSLFGGGNASQASSPTTPSSKGVWDADKEADALFCSLSVEEIRRKEQQTRLDIERRKEDLRQMVGERYRDLIDAADSIVDMKDCSEKVVHSVGAMEQLCQSLQQTHFLRGSGGMRGPSIKSESHVVAAQMKLLADTPERVWVYLEEQSYLQAAECFLLARYVSCQLSLAVPPSSSSTVDRLWHPIAAFKDTLLECCSQRLHCSEVEQSAVVESLCVLVLLQGCSLRQAFSQLLLTRKAAIQAVFHTSMGSGQQHRSVKSQVCELVKTVQSSLLLIAAVCSPSSPPPPPPLSLAAAASHGQAGTSLLLQKLKEFTSPERKGSTQSAGVSSLLTASLPASVTGFVPVLRAGSLTEVPTSALHSSCQEWVNMCVADVAGGLGRLLCHVTSVRALASIRAAVHQLLAQPLSGEGGEGVEWDQVCLLALGRSLCVWDTFLRPLLFDRVKAILDSYFISTSAHASTLLEQLLAAMEADPAHFWSDVHCGSQQLWQEDSTPLTSSTALTALTTLTLQAQACTPSVYSFCQSLGQHLEKMIQDVSHYLDPQLPSNEAGGCSPFSLRADTPSLQEHIRTSSVQCVTRFLQSVDVSVEKLKGDIRSGQVGDPQDLVDRLLLIGRLCRCLLACCPHLARLLSGCHQQPATQQQRRSHSTSSAQQQLRRSQAKKEARAGGGEDEGGRLLQERVERVFRFWSEWTAEQFSRHLGDQLSAEVELSALASSLAWEELSIAEEAEGGREVSSVISIPAQASVYVSSLLFALCQDIAKIGGHSLERSSLLHLSHSVFQEVLTCFEKVVSSTSEAPPPHPPHASIPQSCALQLLFNFKFFCSVLALPGEKEAELSGRVRVVEEKLQSFVDPFDLDVFTPHLLANLRRQLQRSAVLLGALLAVKGPSAVLAAPPKAGRSHEKHVVLPLAATVSRLPSLPLSSSSSSSSSSSVPHHPPSLQRPEVAAAELMKHGQSSLLGTVTFFHHL